MPGLIPARNRAAPAAAILCLAVSWIHIQDQGGFPGDKTPYYVAVGYYLLEAVGLIAAIALVATLRRRRAALPWLLALGVAAGPLTGYLLSRGPGLPGYSDDRGNWTEPLGLASLAVEGALLALTATVLLLVLRARQRVVTAPPLRGLKVRQPWG